MRLLGASSVRDLRPEMVCIFETWNGKCSNACIGSKGGLGNCQTVMITHPVFGQFVAASLKSQRVVFQVHDKCSYVFKCNRTGGTLA